jgi:hypothetical protein
VDMRFSSGYGLGPAGTQQHTAAREPAS